MNTKTPFLFRGEVGFLSLGRILKGPDKDHDLCDECGAVLIVGSSKCGYCNAEVVRSSDQPAEVSRESNRTLNDIDWGGKKELKVGLFSKIKEKTVSGFKVLSVCALSAFIWLVIYLGLKRCFSFIPNWRIFYTYDPENDSFTDVRKGIFGMAALGGLIFIYFGYRYIREVIMGKKETHAHYDADDDADISS